MELVLDENGHAKLEDGFPIYKYEDGTESPFNAKKTLDNLNKKIGDVDEEKTRHFTKLKATEKKLGEYKGISSVDAVAAIDTVKNLKGQQILDANGIKALKLEMRESFNVELAEKQNAWKTGMEEKEAVIANREKTIKYQAITTKFANSKFFSGKTPKTIYPPQDAVQIFGHRFKVEEENGEIVILGKNKDGTTIMSQKDHGDPANFDEAMAKIIEDRPEILNPSPGGPQAGGNLGSGKVDKDASPVERIAAGLKTHHANKFQQ